VSLADAMVMIELDPQFTFDTLVIGPANRLASAVARCSADSLGASYSPLFIYAALGLQE
jgi:chromosomal replication initiation ATPase DnaA